MIRNTGLRTFLPCWCFFACLFCWGFPPPFHSVFYFVLLGYKFLAVENILLYLLTVRCGKVVGGKGPWCP